MKIGKLTRKAEQDLEHIFVYTIDLWGFNQAINTTEVEKSVFELTNNPAQGRSINHVAQN